MDIYVRVICVICDIFYCIFDLLASFTLDSGYRQRRSMQTMPVSGEETDISPPTVNSEPQECILHSATPEGKSILSITRTPQSAPAKTKSNKSAGEYIRSC